MHNQIRGLSPFPTAYTIFQDKVLKIFESKKELKSLSISAGEYVSDGKTYLKFATSDGAINILDVQLEGKKRMKIEDFLRGKGCNIPNPKGGN